MTVSKELPADVWRFVESAEKHGAAVAIYDNDDNIIFTNAEFRSIYKYADFSLPQTYNSVCWKAVEVGLVDDSVFLDDPHAWLAGANQFRKRHRLAQYFIHHRTDRTYLAHHQNIDGFGTIAARFDCTGTLISNEMIEDSAFSKFDPINGNPFKINFACKYPVPTGVVSMTGKLIDADKDFLDILERADGVSLASGKMLIDSEVGQAHFERALRKIGSTSSVLDGELVEVSKNVGRGHYVLSVGPVRASSFFTTLSLRGVSLVSIVDLESKPKVDVLALQKLFDLTAAEARVAISICNGDGVAEIAESHNVSIGTVRNQLKSVFAKIGVNRQPDLVRLVYNISLVSHSVAR
jgi:DNA-binding CsgD family transcriptional regulator